jgi:hypothetical protein
MNYKQIKNKIEKINENISKLNTKTEDLNDKYYEGYKNGVIESFNLFNSTVQFYKQYKDDVKLLMKEQNKLWYKWVEYYNNKTGIDKNNFIDYYNKWLFENLFSNYIDESKDILNLC